MPEERPALEATTLHSLLFASGWTQKALARKLGFANDKQLTRYEREGKNLSREYLGKLLAPLGLPPEAPDVLLWALGLIFPQPEEAAAGDPFVLTAEERGRIHRTVLGVEWSRAEELRRRLESDKREEKVAAAWREAEALVSVLKSASAEDRQRLLAGFPEFQSWALAAALAHASAPAAAHKVKDARELVELALEVARRVPGEAERARTAGYCTGFLANVWRVATEFDAASEVFVQTWELWQAGAAAASLPLVEWRLLDLEASLRREQHRFAEASELLDQALAACDGGALATGRLLTKKANVLQQMGEHEGALAALKEATPAIAASGDPDLLLRLRFNMAVNLIYLERFAAAAQLLPEVRELAIEQARKLDLNRVTWLTARLAAGQGRVEEAKVLLGQVIGEFTSEELAYEAALASLDLAVLYLKEGRTAEVKRLALGMGWIFKAKGIAREALAALAQYCEAAGQEAATVELAKRVIADMEKAQSSAPPPRERPRG